MPVAPIMKYKMEGWLQNNVVSQSLTYDQNFLKKISIQTTIKMSLTFYFELHFKMCAQLFITMLAVGTMGRLLIWIPLDLPEGIYSTTFRLFDLHDKVLRTHPAYLSQGVHVSEGMWKEVVIT
jgi:hypothetical protein